jgi:hypothetical protein
VPTYVDAIKREEDDTHIPNSFDAQDVTRLEMQRQEAVAAGQKEVARLRSEMDLLEAQLADEAAQVRANQELEEKARELEERRVSNNLNPKP